MLLSSEQLQLRDTIRAFFAEECSSEYLRKRWNSKIESDSNLWAKINDLGLFEFFKKNKQGEGGSVLDIALIAYECGRALLPELLYERIYLGPYLFSSLPQKKAGDFARISGVSLAELCEGRTLVSYWMGENAKVLDYVPSAQTSHVIFTLGTDKSGNTKLGAVNRKSYKDKLEQLALLDYLHIASQLKSVKIKPIAFDKNVVNAIKETLLLLRAAELAGISARVTEMTKEHVKTRKQFDVEIGSFQAVQHRLADMHVQSEAMRCLANFAAWCADASKKQLALSATAAIKFAIQNAPIIVESAIQLHGGMGFTWEHDLHLYLRRARSLEALSAFVNTDATNSLMLAAAR